MKRTPLQRKTPLRSAGRAAPDLGPSARVHPCIQRRLDHHDPETRFWAKVSVGWPPLINPRLGPCLLHSGADNGNGYVQFRYNERGDYAHRYAWERTHGTIPDGLTVDHRCEVKRCVNVKHFKLETSVDNYRRTKLAITHCPNNHEYRPGSFKMRRGRRECLICLRAAQEREKRRRSRSLNGLPNRRIRYDQDLVRQVISEVRAATETIAAGARRIGCNPNYLGRRTWEQTRQAVLEREQGRCARCSAQATDAHHRTPRGTGGSALPRVSFGMDNLVALCRTCHEWIESNRKAAFEQGWLVRRGTDPSTVPVLVHGEQILLTRHGCYADLEGNHDHGHGP